MMIDVPPPSRAGVRELHTSIPVSLLIELHHRKINTGKSIADSVKDALAAYFALAGHEGPRGS